MAEIKTATAVDAPALLYLYVKAMESCGFKNHLSKQENVDHLAKEVKRLAEEGKLSFMSDANGPYVLMHFEPDNSEVVTMAVRDGLEGKDYATEMMTALQSAQSFLMTKPVTRGGMALAKKCGFTPTDGPSSDWTWTKSPSPPAAG